MPHAAANSPAHRVQVKECGRGSLLFLRQRVQVAHQAFQALFQYMGIDLRGRNIGVTKKRLDDTQIRPIVQEMAGKSVAQHMRADLRRTQSRGPGERL